MQTASCEVNTEQPRPLLLRSTVCSRCTLLCLIKMCIQIIELWACGCPYFQHEIDACVLFNRAGHEIQEKEVFIADYCWIHARDGTSTSAIKAKKASSCTCLNPSSEEDVQHSLRDTLHDSAPGTALASEPSCSSAVGR